MRCLRFAPGRAAARRQPPAVEIRPVNSEQDRPGASFQVVRHAGWGGRQHASATPQGLRDGNRSTAIRTLMQPQVKGPASSSGLRWAEAEWDPIGYGKQSLSSRTTLFRTRVLRRNSKDPRPWESNGGRTTQDTRLAAFAAGPVDMAADSRTLNQLGESPSARRVEAQAQSLDTWPRWCGSYSSSVHWRCWPIGSVCWT
jgi:hypothetical protein